MTTSSIRRVTLACAWFALLASSSLIRSAAAQSCPGAVYSGSAVYGPTGSGSSADPVAVLPPNGATSMWYLGWNHSLGTVHSDSWGSCSYGGGSSWVRSIDDFVLVGPSAAPVSITVNAAAHVVLGSGYYDTVGPFGGTIRVCTTGAFASLRLVTANDSTSASLSETGCPAPRLDPTLSLNVMVTPGVPFRVAMVANTGATCGTGSVDATLSFANVPAGWSIQSCGGFVGSVAVPVRSTSWGRLKSAYR